MTSDAWPLGSLTTLLAVHAGPDAPRHRLIWAFDARLAQLLRTTSEPVIGQMRLAWWQDVLTDDSGTKGRGEPLLAAMREAGVAKHPGLLDMLDGWEALMGDAAPDAAALRLFGEGRGGGLFRALAGEVAAPPSLDAAGALWALWDFSGHVAARQEAEAAIAAARDFLPLAETKGWPRDFRPMRLAAGLARHDVVRWRVAPNGLTPRLYGRLLRLTLVGR